MTTVLDSKTRRHTPRPARRRRVLTEVSSPVALVLILAALPFLVDAFTVDVLDTGIVYGTMAMGLAVLVGRAGLPSLGHAAFVGVGGYAGALLAVHVTANLVAGLLVGACASVLLSLLVGVISLRSHGVYFLMVSLAVAELTQTIAVRSTFTGGDNGLSTIPTADVPVFSALGVDRVVAMYWFTIVIAALVYVALRLIVASPLGISIVGSRDNPNRMRSLGYSIPGIRVFALAVSGACAGLGGVLLMQKDTIMSPSTLDPDVSILLLVIVLIGGARSLAGPMLAGIALIYLRARLSSLVGDSWVLLLGMLFVLTVYLLPRGFAGLISPRSKPGGSHEH